MTPNNENYGAYRPSVLVVDDEYLNIKLAEACLSQEGFAVRGAPDADAALKAIDAFVPDVILLDIMMPGVDGYSLCRRLKNAELTRAVPVIMITALSDAESRIRAMEAGADDFLAKPLDIFEMGVRVKSLLRIKSYHDDLAQSLRTIAVKNRRLQELECVKEALIHMIIHDMRGPLTGVYGKLQILQLEQTLASDHRTEVDACLTHCQRLNAMIEEILDIHRMDRQSLKPNMLPDVNPLATARSALACFQSTIREKKIRVELHSTGQLPDVAYDPNLICRVLTNLVDNAVRVTPTDGSLGIRIAEPPDMKGIRFQVVDSGPGLPAAYHEKIFNKFEQIGLRKQGIVAGTSGLGLTFCKMAVEAHNGRIWVENRTAGPGCRFTLDLPFDRTLPESPGNSTCVLASAG